MNKEILRIPYASKVEAFGWMLFQISYMALNLRLGLEPRTLYPQTQALSTQLQLTF